MMWLMFTALTVGALVLLLLPLFRTQSEAADRASYDLVIFKDQLKEVDTDIERGVLTPAQADAARTEIKRRMLAVAGGGKAHQAGQTGRFAAAATVAVVVIAGTAALYGYLGAPGLPDQPFASRPAAPSSDDHNQLADIEKMVDTLAERLKTEPDNVEGWVMLARSAKALERYGQAAEAYRRAIVLGSNGADMHTGLGETLIYANDGEIMPEAVQAFELALQADPTEPRARFYLGLAHDQMGDAAGAIAIWKHLENDAPADAPWLAGLQARIAEVASESGIDPATVEPKPPVPGAGGTPVASAPAPAAPPGSTAEEQAQIDAMVAGLAERLRANPDDAEGWKRLGQSYRVQDKLDLAKEAYAKAMALLPQDADVRLAFADVLLAQAGTSGQISDELPTVLREVLAIEPENPDALYFLGAVEAEAGRASEAKALWNRLLATLPENSPERVGLKQQIDALGG